MALRCSWLGCWWQKQQHYARQINSLAFPPPTLPQGTKKPCAVLFGAAGVGGRPRIHALLTRSTAGLRALLSGGHSLGFAAPLLPADADRRAETDQVRPELCCCIYPMVPVPGSHASAAASAAVELLSYIRRSAGPPAAIEQCGCWVVADPIWPPPLAAAAPLYMLPPHAPTLSCSRRCRWTAPSRYWRLRAACACTACLTSC